LDVRNVRQDQRKPQEEAMRRAARVDATQEQIVSALRAAGAYVWIIGLPVDLLVGYKGKTFLVEVKSGPKKPLTKLQDVFFLNWPGGTLARIDGPEAALRMIGVVK
jgi:hypothetical protein